MAQQDNYRKSGFELAHRTVRFIGTVPTAQTPPGVRPAAAADFASIAAYDGACCPADRPRFLERWLTGPGHRTFVRVADGHLTGYAVVRPALDRPRVGPLFADTAEDARALLLALAADAPGGEVAIDIPESNAPGVALAEEFGLTPSFETARMYTGPVRPFSAERVYGVTTLELG